MGLGLNEIGKYWYPVSYMNCYGIVVLVIKLFVSYLQQ